MHTQLNIKPVPEWQTILDYVAARDDGGGSSDSQNYRKQSSSRIITINKPTLSFYRPRALPVTQTTVS